MRYLLDANSIITPFRQAHLRSLSVGMRHSSPSETEKFLRDWFTDGFRTGVLLGTEELFEEVCGKKKQDTASQLLKRLRKSGQVVTLSPRPETFAHLGEITGFVRTHFEPHHVDEFLKGHDPMLVALAISYGTGIITEERYTIRQRDGATQRIGGKVGLPYIAWAFGVRCIPLFYALLKLGSQESEEQSTFEDLSTGA